jgi:hypothetical protein
MQHFATLITLMALASNAIAANPWGMGKGPAAASSWKARETGTHQPRCLTNTTASTLINGYTYLLEKPTGPNFTSISETILTEDFSVWSDSIRFLRGHPVS